MSFFNVNQTGHVSEVLNGSNQRFFHTASQLAIPLFYERKNLWHPGYHRHTSKASTILSPQTLYMYLRLMPTTVTVDSSLKDTLVVTDICLLKAHLSPLTPFQRTLLSIQMPIESLLFLLQTSLSQVPSCQWHDYSGGGG